MIALVLLEWSSLSHSCGPWGSGLGSDFPFCGVYLALASYKRKQSCNMGLEFNSEFF